MQVKNADAAPCFRPPVILEVEKKFQHYQTGERYCDFVRIAESSYQESGIYKEKQLGRHQIDSGSNGLTIARLSFTDEGSSSSKRCLDLALLTARRMFRSWRRTGA